MYDKTQTNPPTNVWQNTNKSSYKCTEKWDMTKHKQILLQMYWDMTKHKQIFLQMYIRSKISICKESTVKSTYISIINNNIYHFIP
jgi:hypothetical protein